MNDRAALGKAAEHAVVELLRREGLLVLGVNLRVGHLEVDILARDGCTLIVVEVRTRGAGSWAGAFASIDPAKRRRLRSAGNALWKRHRADRTLLRMRFDAAAVRFESDGIHVDYVRAAF